MRAQYTTGTDQRTEAWSSAGESGLCLCWRSDNTPGPYLENILPESTPGIGCPRGFPWFSLATQDNSGILLRLRHITSFQISPQSSSSTFILHHSALYSQGTPPCNATHTPRSLQYVCRGHRPYSAGNLISFLGEEKVKRQSHPCNRAWRLPHLPDSGGIVSLMHRSPFFIQEDSWYSFL
jgi:hypothetical protein